MSSIFAGVSSKGGTSDEKLSDWVPSCEENNRSSKYDNAACSVVQHKLNTAYSCVRRGQCIGPLAQREEGVYIYKEWHQHEMSQCTQVVFTQCENPGGEIVRSLHFLETQVRVTKEFAFQ